MGDQDASRRAQLCLEEINADGATLTDLMTPRPPQDVQKHRE